MGHHRQNHDALLDRDAFTYYRRLSRAREAVINQFPNVEPAEVAREAGFSTEYFRQFFRSKTGFTFHTWLRRLRVECAKELFSHANYSVTEVASRVGFGSTRTMQRAFNPCNSPLKLART